ncbi:hypothetical protein QFZ22_002458 [Streptomyces canus]|uniref:Uncharacterized protein n=1 Tax=Streptomyces canus TaxID=58343 RepID=A0AAW8FCC8_9ACTN|nr:hypothetical protein [Streptomyces canus]
MTGGADVPLDAAGEPGAVQREVRGLEHRVAVKEFTPGRLVDEGSDPAAEAGEDGGSEPVVLDHDRLELAGRALSAVAVPDADGQQAVQRSITGLPGHVPGQVVPVPYVDAMVPHCLEGVGGTPIAEEPQRGQGVVRAQRCGGQGEYVSPDVVTITMETARR